MSADPTADPTIDPTMIPVDPDRLALIIGRGIVQQTALEQQLEGAIARIAELETKTAGA